MWESFRQVASLNLMWCVSVMLCEWDEISDHHFFSASVSLSAIAPSGPICSACVDNFGARPVTIFSGVMVAGGLMLSAFAPNVEFLMFSYGIVVGKETLYNHTEWHPLLCFMLYLAVLQEHLRFIHLTVVKTVGYGVQSWQCAKRFLCFFDHWCRLSLFSSNIWKSCNTLYNHLEQTGAHGLVELFRTIKCWWSVGY